MLEYAGTIMGWLNGDGRWVDRYAWFTDWDPGGQTCDENDNPIYEDGGKWAWQMLYNLTPTPTPSYNPCLTTSTPVPMPGMQYSNLGVYYSQVVPAPPAPKPWPTDFLYLPIISR
jgi:hypothetical protein